MRELKRVAAFVQRYGAPASVIYFDLDDLKAVNDRFGHAAGDAALKAVADRLAGHVRETDVVGRMGGDEFAVLLVAGRPADRTGQGRRRWRGWSSAEPVQGGEWLVPVRVSWGVRQLDPLDGSRAADRRGRRGDVRDETRQGPGRLGRQRRALRRLLRVELRLAVVRRDRRRDRRTPSARRSPAIGRPGAAAGLADRPAGLGEAHPAGMHEGGDLAVRRRRSRTSSSARSSGCRTRRGSRRCGWRRGSSRGGRPARRRTRRARRRPSSRPAPANQRAGAPMVASVNSVLRQLRRIGRVVGVGGPHARARGRRRRPHSGPAAAATPPSCSSR